MSTLAQRAGIETANDKNPALGTEVTVKRRNELPRVLGLKTDKLGRCAINHGWSLREVTPQASRIRLGKVPKVDGDHAFG